MGAEPDSGSVSPLLAGDPVGWASRLLSAAGIESPRLEAQLLLALALNRTRTQIAAGLLGELSAPDRERFRALVERRLRRVPLAYLRGTQEFYGLEFLVTPDVLIPRPETEMLVDFAREQLCSRTECSGPIFADVGTGSGCIAISALSVCPRARAVAVDISPGAIEAAARNAERLGVASRIRLAQCDLLLNVRPRALALVVSNPPYIAEADLRSLQPEVRDMEPRVALSAGADGLALYRRLAPQAHRCLAAGGWLALEVGAGQAAAVGEILTSNGFGSLESRRDLAGIERLVAGRAL